MIIYRRVRGPRKSLGGGQQLHGEPCHHYLQQPGPGQAGDTGSLWLANSWQQVGPVIEMVTTVILTPAPCRLC